MSSEPGLPADALRMGRIGYLNVLPIYHPLEAGIIPHDFEIISGPPAVLNNMMARGELHISSNSCFEYAMRPERYHLVEDLSIGSHGNVMSVLLMSRRPVEQLGGQTILISGETHTSVALLRLLMKDHYHCDVNYVTGAVTPTLGTDRAPEAFLAIGRRIDIIHSKGGCKGEVLHIGRYDGIVVGNAVMEGSELPSLFRH